MIDHDLKETQILKANEKIILMSFFDNIGKINSSFYIK